VQSSQKNPTLSSLRSDVPPHKGEGKKGFRRNDDEKEMAGSKPGHDASTNYRHIVDQAGFPQPRRGEEPHRLGG
jgi:hypothetical protein